MKIEEMLEKFKRIHCSNCKIKDKCDGITIQLDGKLKCTKTIENK